MSAIGDVFYISEHVPLKKTENITYFRTIQAPFVKSGIAIG